MITTAQPQLLDLAEAMRGPEWRDELAKALAAAKNAGWDWPRAFLAAARLMADEEAHPRDLTTAVRDPVRKAPAADTAAPAVAAAIASARARAGEAAEAARAQRDGAA
jgi:hypothetical protein